MARGCYPACPFVRTPRRGWEIASRPCRSECRANVPRPLGRRGGQAFPVRGDAAFPTEGVPTVSVDPRERIVQEARTDDRAPRVVWRDKNRIRFVGRVNPLAQRQFLSCVAECRDGGFAGIVADFSECEGAFPRGMLPLLAGADALRRDGIDVSVVMPTNRTLRRLFTNANWAHHLDPVRHAPGPVGAGRHLPALRFADPDRQDELVDAALNVVMQSLRLERDVIAGLGWALNEIMDNVLNHAECAEGGLVQVNTFNESRRVEIAVADSGQGFLASLREGHPDLDTHEQAVFRAIEKGTTRNPENGQGNGLAGAMRIAAHSDGEFGIVTGTAALEVSPSRATLYRQQNQRFAGAFVYVALDMDTRFRLSEALDLGFHASTPVDIIESAYETDDASAVMLQLRKERTGFGTRIAGQRLRTKCHNLLDAAPGKPLVLDWKGVFLVSSSFADEFVGRLFVELSPLVFSARVRHLGMEPNVRGLVNKAILQRAAQTAAANDADASTGDLTTERS